MPTDCQDSQCIAQQAQYQYYEQPPPGSTVIVRRAVEVDWLSSFLLSLLLSIAATVLVNLLIGRWRCR